MLVFALIALLLFARNSGWFGGSGNQAQSTVPINRDPQRLVYSKHAKCRMNCRQIDESEVREILLDGRVNMDKSEPSGDRDPKYALEGTTHDGQHVRIVYAMAPAKTVVVTVIDLGQDIDCTCP